MAKKFYSITEVSKITVVEPHVLRYWETEFTNLRPVKNRAGKRDYEKKDIELILKIKGLLHGELYTIAGAKKKLQEQPGKVSGRETLNFALSEIKKELVSILKLLEND
jgi:DNA-binding transcriptional MerR regulator